MIHLFRAPGLLDKDQIIRLIVKNIQSTDAIVFSIDDNYLCSKSNIMYAIESQCGSHWPHDFSIQELIMIKNHIFTNGEDILSRLDHFSFTNIVIFDFEKRPYIKQIMTQVDEKTNIIGITDGLEDEVYNAISKVKSYKKQHYTDDKIHVLMNLQYGYSREIIDSALSSLYLEEKCSIQNCENLDSISNYWKKNKLNKEHIS